MRIAFNSLQEERTTLFVSEYEIRTWLHRGKWPNNWEWIYDFPDLRSDLIADIKFYLAHFCLKVLAWLGVYIQKGFPHETVRVSYREIETNDILDAIMAQIEQNRRLAMDPSMIIIGPDARRELMNIHEPFTFSAEVKYGKRQPVEGPFGEPFFSEGIYVFDIPILFVPSAIGATVIPDMTGHWSKSLLEQTFVDRRGLRVDRETARGLEPKRERW